MAYRYPHLHVRNPLNLSCMEYKYLNMTLYMYDLVHIRRGDVLRRFNNSVSTSVQKVSKTVNRIHNRSFGLLYTTNERNTEYLENLTTAMRQINSNATFLDDVMKGRCPGNNYCTFCASLRLRAASHAASSFGRH